MAKGAVLGELARYGAGCMLAMLCGLAGGCGTSARGTFGPQGFSQTVHGYRVKGEADQLLPEDWQVDNYYREGGKLKPKVGPFYMASYELDWNGDGIYDTTEEELGYDLRYTHRKRDAVIWLRTFPISTNLAEKDLRVLMQGYLDEVAGAGYEGVRLNADRNVVVEKRYAAELREKGEAKLAGMPAYAATFDVANIDQIKLTPSTRKSRVRVVLARTKFAYTSRKQRGSLPVLLLAGYANLPEDFAQDLPAFEAFLQRIEVGGKAGFSQKLVPSEAAAPKPAQAVGAEPGPAEAPSAGPGPAKDTGAE